MCVCTGTGYTGVICETEVDYCESSPCTNGATCFPGVKTYSCACQTGWAGAQCQQDINDCVLGVCKNGGLCTDNGPNNYTCDCGGTGHSGSNCQNDYIDCTSGPCNSGTCTDTGPGVFTCDCHGVLNFGTQCEFYLPLVLCAPVLLGAVVALYFFMRKKYPQATNSAIFVVALALYDLIADVALVLTLWQDFSPYFNVLLAFLLVPSLLNFVALGFIIVRAVTVEDETGLALKRWFSKQSAMLSLAALLSVSQLDVFLVLKANLFHSERFCAPFTEDTIKSVNRGRYLGYFLKEIPQLVIQIMIAQRNLSTVVLLGIFASVLALTFGLLRRTLDFVFAKFGYTPLAISDSRRLPSQTESDGDDATSLRTFDGAAYHEFMDGEKA